MQAPTGGVLSPRTTASATSATSGAPAGSAAVPASAAPATSAPASRTVVCPRRSTSRPSSGPPTPSDTAKAPATTPAVANEPVRWRDVDEQRDAEHGHRQARDDRDGGEAQGAGRRGEAKPWLARLGRHWFTDEGQLGP